MARIGGTGSVVTLTTSSVIVSAWNAGRPVISSNRIIPSAQRSVRASTSLGERICSGDM